MEHCTVISSANAGISLTFGGVRIWVDAVHQEQVQPFSTVSPALWAKMQEHPLFAAPDLIFFTHCHPDHYSKQLAAEAAARWPQARLILPEPEFPEQLLLTGSEMRFQALGLSFRFLRLTHEGPQYASVPHYGLLLSDGTHQILLPGDCELSSPTLEACLRETQVDLAILDFPWLTLRKSREFTERVIHPAHLLIDHLPFAGEDTVGYCQAARKAAQLMPGIPDLRIMEHALQTEHFDFS